MRFVFCLALLITSPAFSQGFNTFSGRNHPELDWQVAETEHVEIMYPARLAGIENRAAAVAEASYRALSKNLNVTFDEKIRIYLSDEDEIANGFAVPIGSGYTNIWVHVNEAAALFTGREKWLRKVLAHELTHIFHYRAVRTGLGVLGDLFADPLPRFWTEGLAQYETERWDAQRGDRWLRTAVLDDDLSYRDGRSIYNGRLLYAVGSAQVRYFAEQYGDSTLARLLAHRKDVLFGLAEVHDFATAFEEVTGKSYRRFYDDWRRHVNVYYNTLAGQLETVDSLTVDSLGGGPTDLPGQFLYDVEYSRDTTRVATLSLASVVRPVRRLYVTDREKGETEVVAEGAIQPPVSWSPDGRHLAFARRTRGAYSSLLNDIYMVDADGSDLYRLTYSRRASSPTFAPDGERLAFVGSSGGTANLFLLDLETGQETQLTHFTGDVQITSARWHPSRELIAFARFTAGGTRDIVLFNVADGTVRSVTDPAYDNRLPVWRPDGQQLAYTSLRDDVPNVFVYDLESGSHRRVTYVVTGVTARDWLPADSALAEGQLAVLSTRSQTRDRALRVDAGRTAPSFDPQVPEPYTDWTTQRPPHAVPPAPAPRPDLITERYEYSSWSNITHAASLPLPYYSEPDDWGLFGFTTWVEPLGKHVLFAGGGLSLPAPLENSFFLGSYVNNQWYPTLNLSGYRLPGSGRIYGGDLLVENLLGGELGLYWPLDWFDAPYTATTFDARMRYVGIEPIGGDDVVEGVLPSPKEGEQADLRIGLTWRRQRPYRYNDIHPLDGLGLRARLTGAAPLLGGDSRFLRGDLTAYGIFPALGHHRFYLYGRAQAQTGESFPQDFLGLSRYDDVRIELPGTAPVSLGGAERVRGYRRYALGTRLLFGTLEYRIPLVNDLQTEVLGLASLGPAALALFSDAGLVWSGDFDRRVERLGVGVEVKNVLRLAGFRITHALGLAQPASKLGLEEDYDLYYRIRTAVPF